MTEDKWYDNAELREPEAFERLDALKLGSGVHEIKFENDGKEVVMDDYNDPKIQITKIIFDVNYAGKTWAWFVREAETTTSLYGQLTSIAKKHGGLTGHSVKVIAAGSGKGRKYDIIDVDGKPLDA